MDMKDPEVDNNPYTFMAWNHVPMTPQVSAFVFLLYTFLLVYEDLATSQFSILNIQGQECFTEWMASV